MNKTNRNRDRNKQIIPLAAIALSAVVLLTGVVSIATSGTKAKYKETVHAGDVAVTVNANLASLLEVKEHQAVRGDTGEYSLSSGTEVTSNSYVLMPGVDIPKDPFVRVAGKTEIPAYLYIEVIDETGGSFDTYSYTVDSANWTPLKTDEYADVTGKNGGKVYVYRNGTKLTDVNMTNGTLTAGILTDDKITVKPGLDVSSDYSSATLTFYAYMAQAVDGKTAYEIFRTQLAS